MKTISVLQERLSCCGIDDYEDWEKLNKNFNPHNVPVSCCRTEFCGQIMDGVVQLHPSIENGTENGTDTRKIYTNGCYKQIVNFVSTNTVAVLICSYGLAIFQLIGIIFSCCLCKAIQGAGSYRNVWLLKIVQRITRKKNCLCAQKSRDQKFVKKIWAGLVKSKKSSEQNLFFQGCLVT